MIPAYITLQKEIHDALRVQHPEWVGSDGSSPICDSYEARFAELLRLFTRRPRAHGGNHYLDRSKTDQSNLTTPIAQ